MRREAAMYARSWFSSWDLSVFLGATGIGMVSKLLKSKELLRMLSSICTRAGASFDLNRRNRFFFLAGT